SMVYHWRRGALDRLYDSCVRQDTSPEHAHGVRWPWPIGPSRIEMACLAYSAKTSQIESICELVTPRQLMVVEYDRMVEAPSVWLPRILAFIGEPYDASYGAVVDGGSVKED